MWAKPRRFLFVAHVVFPGETVTDQPTICSNLEIRRLLHSRLEVLEAALQRLAEFRDKAARAQAGCNEPL